MEGFDADLSGAKFAKVALQADRFSQYGAKREDSGIGSEIGGPLGVTPGVSAGDLGAVTSNATAVTEELLAEQLEQISLPSLQRRKSLPSLVKRDITGSLKYPEETTVAAAAAVHSPETILIEDGTKKRLVATDKPGQPSASNAAPSLPNPRTPTVLPKAVVAETITPKLTKSELNRSFTDLASANKGTEGISRVEASQLGSQRREEIRRAKEFEASQTEFDRFRAQMKVSHVFSSFLLSICLPLFLILSHSAFFFSFLRFIIVSCIEVTCFFFYFFLCGEKGMLEPKAEIDSICGSWPRGPRTRKKNIFGDISLSTSLSSASTFLFSSIFFSDFFLNFQLRFLFFLLFYFGKKNKLSKKVKGFLRRPLVISVWHM